MHAGKLRHPPQLPGEGQSFQHPDGQGDMIVDHPPLARVRVPLRMERFSISSVGAAASVAVDDILQLPDLADLLDLLIGKKLAADIDLLEEGGNLGQFLPGSARHRSHP